MQSGDTVTDGRGTTWTIAAELGRGSWGRSWIVRDASGNDRVLKVALGAEDFPADTPLPEGLVDACAAAVHEQAALLERSDLSFLPRLEGQLEVAGRPALLISRYPSSLARRLQGGVPLTECIQIVLATCERLMVLQKRIPHGNLRPTNVLINERGEPVLADVLTEVQHPWWHKWGRLVRGRDDFHPPEARDTPSDTWDTWALCLTLYAAAMLPPQGPDPRRPEPVELPAGGLDKVALATLKDRTLARLKSEAANPRFVNRAVDKLSSLLNRGITRETDPSPPFRFHTAADLHKRLAEVAALLHPRVDDVGRLLLSSNARDAVFQGGEVVGFTVSVGCTADAAHEDVGVGIQIVDLDAAGDGRLPVPDARYTVKSHPSGRLRFEFELPDVPPGRYRANLAFSVRDSHHDPAVASGEFEVRPPPGYVPPPSNDPEPPNTLSFPGARREPPVVPPSSVIEDEAPPRRDEPSSRAPEPTPLRQAPSPVPAPITEAEGPVTSADLHPDPDSQVEDSAFPMPIAPSSPSLDLPTPPHAEEPPPRRVVSSASPTPLEPSPAPSREAPPPTVPPVPQAVAAIPEDTIESDAGVSSSEVPRPTIAPPPSAAPHHDRTVTQVAPPRPQPVSSAPGPGTWEELPGPDAPPPSAPAEPWLPGADRTEELEAWGGDTGSKPTTPQEWLDYAIALAKRDTYTALMVGLVPILALILGLVIVLRACS